MRFRAIWISDLHLGSRHAQAGMLVEFLRLHDCEHLYLVGDMIDGWELKRRWHWTEEANTVIQKVLRKNRKRTRVTYIHGNHDEFLREYTRMNVGGVRIAAEALHVGADGRRYLVIHGHQLDGLVHFNRLLERLGSRLYDAILVVNTLFNRVRRRLGFGHWSVAAYLKKNTKSAVCYMTRFEEGMVELARKHGVDGVICGHIHHAEIRDVEGVRYLNCGDWVESCTALAEDYAGNVGLLRLHEHGTVRSWRWSGGVPSAAGAADRPVRGPSARADEPEFDGLFPETGSPGHAGVAGRRAG